MVKIDLFKAGHCMQCEKLARKKGVFKNVKFPMIVGYIEYGEEKVLFDTGYSEHFKECTSKYPQKLYDLLVPVTLEEKSENIYNVLKENNIDPESITKIILSHFHADHISGVNSFSNVDILCSKEGYKDFKDAKGLMAVREGYLKNLLPEDFESRSSYFENLEKVEKEDLLEGFNEAYWLDKSAGISLIELKGHKKGHFGLYIKSLNTFFIADSCWQREAYMNLDFPSFIGLSIQENKKDYINTIKKINKLYKLGINMIPCHCIKTYNEFKKEKNHDKKNKNNLLLF